MNKIEKKKEYMTNKIQMDHYLIGWNYLHSRKYVEHSYCNKIIYYKNTHGMIYY